MILFLFLPRFPGFRPFTTTEERKHKTESSHSQNTSYLEVAQGREQSQLEPPPTLRQQQLMHGAQGAQDTETNTHNAHASCLVIIQLPAISSEYLKLLTLKIIKSFLTNYPHSITTSFSLKSLNSQFSYMRCSRNSWSRSFIFNTVKNITQSGQVIVAMETLRFFCSKSKSAKLTHHINSF